MGNNMLHMGAVGSGQLTKLINQLLFDINAAALAEILPMAVKMGLDAEKVGSVVNSGTGRSYASEFFIPRVLQGNFADGYAMRNAYKDLVSAAELGGERLHPDAGAGGGHRDLPGGAAAGARRQGQGRHDPGLRGDARGQLPASSRVRRRAGGGLTMAAPKGLDNGLTNYGDRDFARFLRRSFARSMGISRELLGKPVVGIAMTPSGFNNCHRYMPDLVEAVSRGVLAAGALPRPFPTVSLGEVFLNPTSMMYRNLMAMDTEEMIGAQPMDAVVLIGGCDKTVPAQLMGAASAGLPAIQLVTGPMSTGRHKGQRLGACTDCRGFWAKYRAGTVDADEIATVEGRLSVTAGTCAVMGTASTMACIAEALGMSLPGTAAIPAVHSDRLVAAEETGKAAVRLIESGITPAPGHHREVGRERHPRADGGRRLDQRHRAPDRRRRAARHQGLARRGSTSSRTRRRCWST